MRSNLHTEVEKAEGEAKGKTSTVMAKGDAYDTGKNTAGAASGRNGHDTADSGATALRDKTSDIVTVEKADTTGSLGSTILSSDETAHAVK